MKIFEGIEELVGNTPLVRLSRFCKACNVDAQILAKLEWFNPSASVKDRAALHIILQAQKSHLLKKGGTIVEASSGNTAIALAALSAAFGYKLVVFMPQNMSIERQQILKFYGAEVILTDAELGMKGAEAQAKHYALHTQSFFAAQFDNECNPQAHFCTTGLEIWSDTNGKVDCFVAGIGTGGTISGVGALLKCKNPDILVVGVEPQESAVLSGNAPAPHKIMGIGAGFVPKNLHFSVVDRILPISFATAQHTRKQLAQTEGLHIGISSGAALAAALALAPTLPKNALIVALLPDDGQKYLSVD